MGITISHKLKLNKIYVKDALDRAEKMAHEIKTEQADKMEIPFQIRRASPYSLYVDMGGCETLSFFFRSKQDIIAEKEKGWSYEFETLTDGGKKEIDNGYRIEEFPQNEIYFCSSFCKTQYASTILEHYWVAEIIRKVASYCTEAIVNDEGDYYHSGKLDDAKESIASLGKMIDGLGDTFKGLGFEVVGNKTKIKKNYVKRK